MVGGGERETVKGKTNGIGKTISPPLTARDATWSGLPDFVGIPAIRCRLRRRQNVTVEIDYKTKAGLKIPDGSNTFFSFD